LGRTKSQSVKGINAKEQARKHDGTRQLLLVSRFLSGDETVIVEFCEFVLCPECLYRTNARDDFFRKSGSVAEFFEAEGGVFGNKGSLDTKDDNGGGNDTREDEGEFPLFDKRDNKRGEKLREGLDDDCNLELI
jgi:hypothetical protein